MDTPRWQDCYGKDNSRKSHWNLEGKKYRIGNVRLFIENEDYSKRYTWVTLKMTGKKQNMAPTWKKIDEKTLILTNELHFLIAYMWDALNVNANRVKFFIEE